LQHELLQDYDFIFSTCMLVFIFTTMIILIFEIYKTYTLLFFFTPLIFDCDLKAS